MEGHVEIGYSWPSMERHSQRCWRHRQEVEGLVRLGDTWAVEHAKWLFRKTLEVLGSAASAMLQTRPYYQLDQDFHYPPDGKQYVCQSSLPPIQEDLPAEYGEHANSVHFVSRSWPSVRCLETSWGGRSWNEQVQIPSSRSGNGTQSWGTHNKRSHKRSLGNAPKLSSPCLLAQNSRKDCGSKTR